MTGRFPKWLIGSLSLMLHLPCFGQSSTSYHLQQHRIASGGGAIRSANLVLKQSVVGAFAAGSAASGNYTLNGGALITSIEDLEDPSQRPGSFQLLQNYPNPFNPETTIAYTVPQRLEVRISIFNSLGQLVKNLEQGRQPAGQYSLRWDGRNDSGVQVGSGIYYYRMVAAGFSQVRKMLLLR